jgi:hypothetical protein
MAKTLDTPCQTRRVQDATGHEDERERHCRALQHPMVGCVAVRTRSASEPAGKSVSVSDL